MREVQGESSCGLLLLLLLVVVVVVVEYSIYSINIRDEGWLAIGLIE
jgi:hypothetical protein